MITSLRAIMIASAIALTSLFSLTACDEGPVEEAAEEVDQAVENAADAVEDAAEEAGDAVKDATN